MTEHEPIRALRELGAELARVAATEHEREPDLTTRLRSWVDYPGMAKRGVVAVVAAALALGGLAYAIPPTRDAVEGVTGWVAQDDPTPARVSGPDDGREVIDPADATGREVIDPAPPGSGPPEERRAAATTVKGAYGGLADALRQGAMPLAEIPRYALLQAEKIDAFHDVCELLSSAARQEAIDYARQSSGFDDIEWSCAKAVALLLRAARVGGTERQILRTELVAINVDGDRATATLSFGKGRPLSTAPLVREDGEWRIGIAPGSDETKR